MMRILQESLSEGIKALPIHGSLIVATGGSADRVHGIIQDQLNRIIA